MSLQKAVVAQIQHNGLNMFEKSFSAPWNPITLAIGNLEHFYEEPRDPSPLVCFRGQKRRKRGSNLTASPQEKLFSHYYKHLVSMEGGYLAANIGNQRHSTPTISSTTAEKKIIIIIIKIKIKRLFQSGKLWEDFFQSECLKIPWNMEMCNNSEMGESSHLTLFWKHLHFTPNQEHPIIQEQGDSFLLNSNRT